MSSMDWFSSASLFFIDLDCTRVVSCLTGLPFLLLVFLVSLRSSFCSSEFCWICVYLIGFLIWKNASTLLFAAASSIASTSSNLSWSAAARCCAATRLCFALASFKDSAWAFGKRNLFLVLMSFSVKAGRSLNRLSLLLTSTSAFSVWAFLNL